MINIKRMLINGLMRLMARRASKSTDTVEALRHKMKRMDPNPYSPPEGVNYRKETIVDLHCEWFEPEGLPADAPFILYFPGGGFILPAMNGQRDMLVAIAQTNGCRALLAQYRLAPEEMMPTGQIDGFNAYKYVLNTLNQDPKNLFLLGDSAGGNVALSTLVQARDAGLPLPLGAMLLSPATDLTLGCASTLDNAKKDPMFHLTTLIWMMKQSLPFSQAPNDPLVSPAYADMHGLPPMLLEVGSTEMLLDHSTMVTDRARAAGCDVELTVTHKSPHVYPMIGFLPEGKAARARMGVFISRLRQDKPNN